MIDLIFYKGVKMIKAILFDKDGTLIRLDDLWVEPTVDFLMSQCHSLNHDEKKQLLENVGIVEGAIVPNSIVASGTVEELAQALSQVTNQAVEGLIQEMNQYFTEYLRANPRALKPIGNLVSMFNQLKARGLLVGVVTSDSRLPTLAALEILGIDGMLDFVATADDFAWKPAPDSLYHFAKMYQVNPKEVIYVGDSLVDMLYGKYAGATIAVLTGNTQRELLEKDATVVIDSIEKLDEALELIEGK